MKKLFVIFTAVALIWVFAAPASAVEWNFYGSARMETWYQSRDFGDASNAAGTDDKDDRLDWVNESSSRFGVNVKAENIKGQIEFAVADQGMSARRNYGVWDFGAGSLKVGKDYTPVKQFISTQAAFEDLGLLGIGTAYGSRKAQISLRMGSFEVALISPTTERIEGLGAVAATTTSVPTTGGGGGVITVTNTPAIPANGDVDSYLPKIEAEWGMSFDQWNFKLIGGFQWYEIEDVVSAVDGSDNDLDVTSWTIGGDVGFNFGPAYVKGAINYGQNVANAGWHIPTLYTGTPDFGVAGSGSGGSATWDGDDDTDDANTLMFALVAGFKMSDMVGLEGGFGWREDDNDFQNSNDSTYWSAYVNATIALAPGVWIIPEVSYFDWGEAAAKGPNDDRGDELLIGGKWQIDF
jgi:hypothetical protein